MTSSLSHFLKLSHCHYIIFYLTLPPSPLKPNILSGWRHENNHLISSDNQVLKKTTSSLPHFLKLSHCHYLIFVLWSSSYNSQYRCQPLAASSSIEAFTLSLPYLLSYITSQSLPPNILSGSGHENNHLISSDNQFLKKDNYSFFKTTEHEDIKGLCYEIPSTALNIDATCRWAQLTLPQIF